MRPPYSITPKMLYLCTEISRLIGQCEGLDLLKPQPKLRKSSRIKTIQGSLAIEGNTLRLDQVTAVLDGKRVVGNKREVLEAKNAIAAYDLIAKFKPHALNSFLNAHKILMLDLVQDPGRLRTTNVGVIHGSKVAHAAPQHKLVPELMDKLFHFLKNEKETHVLILSAILHYEIEFIHPFTDGNGRMGRLWQTVLLSRFHPIFEFTPVESVVKSRQADYYNALAVSDKAGTVNAFIEFSLHTIHDALVALVQEARPRPLTTSDRLEIAQDKLRADEFTRKDYLQIFKTIATATASRDLSFGVKQKQLEKDGQKRLTKYRFILRKK